MTPHRPVVGVIVYPVRVFPAGKKVLFLKRSGGQYEGEWWPVAGTSKVGEQPVQTALRELHEETALKAEHLFDFGLEIPHLNNTKALSAFVALVDKTSLVTLNFEHSQFRWMDDIRTMDYSFTILSIFRKEIT